jgi:hypothetical protein
METASTARLIQDDRRPSWLLFVRFKSIDSTFRSRDHADRKLHARVGIDSHNPRMLPE